MNKLNNWAETKKLEEKDNFIVILELGIKYGIKSFTSKCFDFAEKNTTGLSFLLSYADTEDKACNVLKSLNDKAFITKYLEIKNQVTSKLLELREKNQNQEYLKIPK